MDPPRPDAAAAPAPAPNSSFAPNATMRRRFVREAWLNGQLHTPENAREFTKFTDWHTRGLCSQLVARPGAAAHFSEDWIDYQVDLAIWGCLRPGHPFPWQEPPQQNPPHSTPYEKALSKHFSYMSPEIAAGPEASPIIKHEDADTLEFDTIGQALPIPTSNTSSAPKKRRAPEIWGHQDADLPKSEYLKGFREVSRVTHEVDEDRGPVNRQTGASHTNTLLRFSNGWSVTSGSLDEWVTLISQWARSAPRLKSCLTFRFLIPWDNQGNVWRVCSNEASSCAVCGGEDHRLENCVGPPIRNIGAIDGCPVCNTCKHDFDDCLKVKGDGSSPPMSLERRFELLVVRRQNKPMINSNQVFRYEECKDFLRMFYVKALPWSRKFTTEQFDKGGPWLHYNYADATPELPRDPANIFWMCNPLEQSFEMWRNKTGGTPEVSTQAPTQPPSS